VSRFSSFMGIRGGVSRRIVRLFRNIVCPHRTEEEVVMIIKKYTKIDKALSFLTNVIFWRSVVIGQNMGILDRQNTTVFCHVLQKVKSQLDMN
jgi:hypothetical protein